MLRQRLRRRGNANLRRSHDGVAAPIGEPYAVATDRDRQARTPLRPTVSLHFEDICEVGAEPQRDGEAGSVVAEVGQRQALIQAPRPEETRALEVNHPIRDRALAQCGQRAVREVRGEERAVLGDRRTEKRRTPVRDAKLQRGKDARVIRKEAFVPAVDVPGAICEQEGVTILECEAR